MNKILSSLAATALLTLSLAGCSDDNASGLFDYVSDNEIAVITGDATDVIVNAGCTVSDTEGVTLSPNLLRIMGLITGDTQEVENVLKFPGIDLSSAVAAVSNDQDPIFMFNLTDPAKFTAWLENNQLFDADDRSTSDGYTIYSLNSRASLLVKDKTVWILSHKRGDGEAVKALKARRDKASATPLATWKKEHLEEHSTFSAIIDIEQWYKVVQSMSGMTVGNFSEMAYGYDPEQLKKACIWVKSDLKGTELKGTVKVMDASGNVMTNSMAVKTDPSIIKYATPDDLAVAMAAIPGDVDWLELIDKYLKSAGIRDVDRSTLAIVSSVLGSIDGTVMVAAGPVNFNNLNRLDGWHLVLAAQLRSGKADEYVGTLQLLCEQQGIPSRMENNVLKIDIDGMGTLQVKAEGNDFVASNTPVTTAGGCPVAASVFSGKCGGMVITFPKDNPFARMVNLPFGAKIEMLSTSEEQTFCFGLPETEGNMLENIIDFAASNF